MINILISLLLQFNHALGNPTQNFDPDLVFFGITNPPRGKALKCWTAENVYEPLTCKFVGNECSIKATFKGLETTDLKFETPDEVQFMRAFSNSLISDASNMSIDSKNFVQIHEVPIGARLIIFQAINNDITIFFDDVVRKNTLAVFGEPKRPIKKISFVPEESLNALHLDIKILGYDLQKHYPPGIDRSKPQYEAKMPLGKFEAKMDITIGSDIYEFSRLIEVSETSPPIQVFDIKQSDFVKSRTTIAQKSLIFDMKSLKLDRNYYHTHSKEGFSGNQNVFISETNKNLSSYFVLEKGDLIAKPDSVSLIKEALRGLPKYTIVVQGACGKYVNYGVFDKWKIYSIPNESGKQLGELVFIEEEYLNLFFVDPTGNKTPFKPSIYGSECRENPTFIHEANSVSGKWIDLGSGPWGTEGWIQHSSEKLFKLKSPSFRIDKVGSINFQKDKDVIIASGSKVDEQVVGDLEYIDAKLNLKKEDITDEKGRLKIILDCGY